MYLYNYFCQRVKPLLAVGICATLFACSSEDPKQYSAEGETMGTRWSIVVDKLSKDQFDRIEEESITLLDELTNRLSTYKEDSELTRFNHSSSLAWHAVSLELADIVEQALRINKLSGGVFDVTAQPLISLWGFESEREVMMPSDDQLREALRAVGSHYLAVRKQPPALRKALPELQINLSAIAKGYAVDRLADIIEAEGGANYLVEIGGELKATGTKADAQPWVVGIETPEPSLGQGRQAYGFVQLQEASIATSGDYRNFLDINGTRYTHIINPHTGMPFVYRGISVTVIAPTALEADAWATAFFILPKETALQLADQHQLGIYFIELVEGDFVEAMNDKFARHLVHS